MIEESDEDDKDDEDNNDYNDGDSDDLNQDGLCLILRSSESEEDRSGEVEDARDKMKMVVQMPIVKVQMMID